jgi:hypothetical protein
MTAKGVRIAVSLFVAICGILCYVINAIPRGNFIGAPAITLFVYIPLLVVQLLILINVWLGTNKGRVMRVSFWSSLFITIIFAYLLYDYLNGTT